jgi:hypothetical protein
MNTTSIETGLTSSIEEIVATAISSPQEMKRLDLSAIKADKSLSLHKLLKTRIHSDNFVANVMVINLDHVYMSDEAGAALGRCYLTAPYLLDRFGSHYLKNIMATATRGNLKGLNYIDPEANTFVHETDGDMDIFVSGKCVEVDGQNLRQIHITCTEKTAASSTN